MRKPMTLLQQEMRDGFLMLLPAIALITVITLLPVLFTLVLSFTDTPISHPTPQNFVGLTNYLHFLGSADFWSAIWRTLYFTMVSVGVELVLGLAIALLIHAKPWGWQFLRASLIIPWAVPTIVNGAIWRWIYNDLNGILNYVLYKLHLISEYVLWTSDPKIVLWAIIVVVVWQGTPFYMMNFLAGLQSIPDELYEAAEIDGASTFQSFLHVTLPGLKSVLIVVTLLSTIWTSNELQFVYILSSGGPAHMSEIFPTLAFFTSIPGRELGLGAAVALSFFPLLASLIVLGGRVLLRGAEE